MLDSDKSQLFLNYNFFKRLEVKTKRKLTRMMTRWPAATAIRFSDDQATALGYDGEVTSEASWNRDAIVFFSSKAEDFKELASNSRSVGESAEFLEGKKRACFETTTTKLPILIQYGNPSSNRGDAAEILNIYFLLKFEIFIQSQRALSLVVQRMFIFFG